MEVLLIITSLWQGNPEVNTVRFPMQSMAECHKKAQEWVRHHAGAIIATCKITDKPATHDFRVSGVRPSASPATP
jgi:hypothetical protein